MAKRATGKKKTRLGILGLGYVGLPLAREFASAGVEVLGFDVDEKKVKTLNSGRMRNLIIPSLVTFGVTSSLIPTSLN